MMAPSRTATIKTKHDKNHSGISNSLNGSKNKTETSSKFRKSQKAKLSLNHPKASRKISVTRHKKRVYSEKELNIPELNMVKPCGVEKPKGRKKGKIFVDDKESMMTILAMVNAEKNGQIESQIMKARQMEEIREARRAESEKRQDLKKSKIDQIKDSMRKKRKRFVQGDKARPNNEVTAKPKSNKIVSFAR